MSGDDRGPVRATEHFEESLAAVGEREFDAVVSLFPAGVADCRGNIGGGGFLIYRPAAGTAVAYDFR